METAAAGILTVFLGGVLNGIFTYPMKLVKGWEWENIWSLFGILGLVVLPWMAAWTLAGDLAGIYGMVPVSTLLSVSALGLAWGIGSVLFGLGISALGLSLGYSIVMGTTAVFGTLIPALWLEPDIFATERGVKLACSLVLVIAGLLLNAVAGKKRDRLADSADFHILRKTSFGRGLGICLLSGVLSACFNIGFAVTTDLTAAAQRAGAGALGASFTVWAPIMGAGFLPNLVYCSYLFRRNGSFGLMRSHRRNWAHAAVMACLWILSVGFYSEGSHLMGSRGATVGWPILVSSSVLGANALGLFTAEWKEMGWSVRGYLYAGLAVLLAAVFLAGSAGPR
jgi:L-rhamnose-H+ transport protein